jgi:hypothetical protein
VQISRSRNGVVLIGHGAVFAIDSSQLGELTKKGKKKKSGCTSEALLRNWGCTSEAPLRNCRSAACRCLSSIAEGGGSVRTPQVVGHARAESCCGWAGSRSGRRRAGSPAGLAFSRGWQRVMLMTWGNSKGGCDGIPR